MSSLTINPSYSGGISQAIADAVAAGHRTLLLEPGDYAADTVTSGAHGPGGAVPTLTIKPLETRESIAVDTLILDGANYLRFVNCQFATAIPSPTELTLPIFDTAAPCLQAGIKLTPVVSDLPVPRFRIRNPKLANQSQNLVVTVEGRDVTVTGVSTDANKAITTTALSIINAVNASPAASALFTASVKDGQDGSGHVQGGLPFWDVWGGNWRDIEVNDFTHHVSVIGCKLRAVKLRAGSHHAILKRNHFPRSSFVLNFSLSQGERTVSDVIFSGNYCYGGYNTDCAGPRPAHYDNLVIDDNLFEDTCDPEASSKHVDSFQPLFGGRGLKMRRNRFIDQAGQCFFMDNYVFHQSLIENNFIHQDGATSLICQVSGLKTAFFRFNTLITNGWLWDDGDSQPAEIPDSIVLYNNISKRFSRTTGVPLNSPDYNIVQTPGTGWTPGANETSTLPTFASPGHPNWDYHYLDNTQPGVGDGVVLYKDLYGSPATDLEGNLRDPASVDQGCFVFAAYVPPVVQEPPNFVAAGTGASRASNGVLQVPYPDGVQADDYLLMHVYFDHGSSNITFSGWTTLSGPNAHTGGNQRDWLLAKVATGTESGTTADSSDVISSSMRMARIYAFRGVDVVGTPYEDLSVRATASSTTLDDFDVTTTGSNRLAINLCSIPDDLAMDVFAGQSGGTWIEPVSEYTTIAGTDGALQIQIADKVAAGVIGGGSMTLSEAELALCYKLALLPS